ncbi:unnamed protein product (macronuclear) [Paramecium tetraurelia]|uniref:RRM domain-containing protein n=1 Tax=Paramecium tetraurelia TaxID=5888 RepID=A0D6I4_PARTE|nr:uncharacterized protein GSPATT00001692001 [Paramecium tetraurelia]CAK78651.1 unnamed protein product [Paramecium tetraurelia]|eukprot:XP_001446048.1 hypothetical protein (macronuclear) [Paramecium tetraurelia strain d4-2]
MAERGHALKQDISKLAWEETDFPIVCNNCLGENPYIRMLKDRFGKECRICARPFTTFKWKPGNNSRQKQTEVCQTCGKIKNICQACFKDLEFNMGLCTRDKFLGDQKIEIPEHTANRDYWAEQANRQIERLILPYDKPLPMFDQILKEPRLADVNNQLNDGKSEPANQIYAEPLENPQDIDLLYKEKFEAKGLLAPDDPKICSLYVSHMTADIKESDLKHLFSKYGKLNSIKIMEHGQSCFINFAKRKDAETAVNALYNNIIIKDIICKIQWARAPNKKVPIKDLIQSLQPEENKKAHPPQAPPQNIDKRQQSEDNLLIGLLNQQMTYPNQNPYQKGGVNNKDI